ncbi:YkgJ family cysteine cluster protein [Parashewanella spongiae]|uniref:YkgJ family cysteine cluster protein n=1 Tax=Parashewanella spongiae TaxID=342950 RepID=A0A3A6THJ2_9GAMM|nr:YkgJ family cysteine cluster protein [Parashewanella spongiae]MCL1079596.1 YkgJ family cysteine cluster protein [Parashewanella spongiae]RJY07258.1 YkgJ family cysteine cluster protein [Parashewanella spongiae]
MECRLACGACCIAPSISSPIPGMPKGKLPGERCVQLSDDNLCKLFGQDNRPVVCGLFEATADVCGHSDKEALWLISALEIETS